MIKKLQSKKGFTLVELIVVIAIIGVLAAVLIPTMLGMVTKARITSANRTAGSIQKTVNAFFVQADASRYGMKPNTCELFDVRVYVDGGKTVWECTAASDSGHFYNASTSIKWGNAARLAEDDSLAGTDSGEMLLLATLAGTFPELDHAAMAIVMKGGRCSLVAYTTEQDTVLSTAEYPAHNNGEPPEKFEWNGKTAGISPGGMVVGTAPAIPTN